MLGIGTGSILLPPVQTSALGMPLLQGHDGAINLLNNIQVGTRKYTWILHVDAAMLRTGGQLVRI